MKILLLPIFGWLVASAVAQQPAARSHANAGPLFGIWEGSARSQEGEGHTRSAVQAARDPTPAPAPDTGKADADIAAHPDAIVYDGPCMDGAPGDTCRIPYLMPLPQAEKLLFKSRGMTSAARAVAPGLPDGLVIHTYDVKAGIYHRLCIVTDGATPDPQVVCMVLKAEGVNYYPRSRIGKSSGSGTRSTT